MVVVNEEMVVTIHTRRRCLVWGCSAFAGLLLPPARAQVTNGIRRIRFSPTRLASGSPVLFSVELPLAASSLEGTWLKHTLSFFKADQGNLWYALAGVDVEQPAGTYALELTGAGRQGEGLHGHQDIAVAPGQYKTTALRVQEKFVAPDPATLQRVAQERTVKDAAYARLVHQPLWKGSFRSPVPFSPTDSFGTRRMFNGELASIHRGTDFHAPAGTPVHAANDGLVILAQPMFYEGNLVVIDHGQQFATQYMHFSKIEVTVGEHVHKGQRLGLSGATGRVTGPHLHFGVRWQGMYVDPVLLLGLKLPQV